MFTKRIFTICSQSMGFTTIFTIFTQMLCSLFLFFLFTIYTQGNWVAGSPLFPSLQCFFFCLNSICQQRELPLFLVACGREILFILFYSVLRREGWPLQFFFFCLNFICQQWELPLFLVACGREILFILFYSLLGREGWPGLPLFLITFEGILGLVELPGVPLLLAFRVGGFEDIFLLVAGVTFISGYEYVLKDEGMGWGKVLLYLGIWGTPSSVSYAAVTHTTSRRRMSASVGGEERVVRMTLTTEGSE